MEVQVLISDLTTATSPIETIEGSLFPQDLNTTIHVVDMVLDYLTQSVANAQDGDMLPFDEVCMYVCIYVLCVSCECCMSK